MNKLGIVEQVRRFVIVASMLSQFVVGFDCLAQSGAITPDQLEFRRVATRRMIFDRSQDIPIAELNPDKIQNLDLMHPIIQSVGQTECSIVADRLLVSADEPALSSRWIGGFNPFATYDLEIENASGTGLVGMQFRDSRSSDHLTACVVVDNGVYRSVSWTVVKDGKEIERLSFPWPEIANALEPVRFRVQMLAVGANLYIEQSGRSHLVGYSDFNQHFELRRTSLMRQFEFCLFTDLHATACIQIKEVAAALTPGCGQADIRAITTRDGKPLLDEGRIWLTMTVRGRALPHPLQGVFSMNPSVFDLKFEGIIVFDMGDGLLRNELASHLFYDDQAKQWRGWTTGFSALGSLGNDEEKAILAVWSERDPRRGFSIMKARPVGIRGQHEDPHGVYDQEANKWRLLLCERAGKYRAGMWESDQWDQGYKRLVGPVEMDSTGTLIQSVGDKRYVFFGSADRKVYICSYPDLQPVGELNMHRPPWNEKSGTRIWPNIIPLPDGYPAPYIAIMMDRENFPTMPARNWTYGAMYLFHGFSDVSESDDKSD